MVDNIKLKDVYDGKTAENTVMLYTHIEKCISNRKKLNKIDRNGYDRTLSKYRVAFRRLKEFASIKYKRDIDFSDIDLNFYNDYIDWLRNIPLADNTIGKDVQTLKRFLNTATVQGINTKLIYKSGDFKTPSKRKNTFIFLKTR